MSTKYPLNRIPTTSLCFYNSQYYSEAADCDLMRETDKNTNLTEKALVAQWWDDMIKNRGYKVDYYVNTFNISEDDKLFGEAPHRAFHPPKSMIMGITINNVAIGLGITGFVDSSNIEAYITFPAFSEAFVDDDIHAQLHDDIEPKAGDVIHLTEFGNDRPGKREGLWFEITSRTDEDIATINQLGGHYVWKIHAERMSFSFEKGLPVKYQQNFVSDNANPGITSTPPDVTNDTPDKPYSMNIDDVSKTDIFDQTKDGRDSVYGNY